MDNSKEKKTIWILHHYATPPTMNGFTRPYQFGINLGGYGYAVKVFAASHLHYANTNLIHNNDLYILNNETPIPFTFVRTHSASGNGAGRVLNMFDYYRNVSRVIQQMVRNEKKPDVIMASSPHPLAMVAGLKIAKRLGVPCICEVRDFWPEVFFTAGKLSENSLIGKWLVRGEHWIYKKADALIFLKEGDVTYITDQKWDTLQGGDISLQKCHYINNGVNLEEYSDQIDQEMYRDDDLDSGKFNVIYAGAIRPVNNVGNILDAAKLIADHEDIQFLIYGDGYQLDALKQRVIDEKIANVRLKGYVDKKHMPYVMSKASVNLLQYSQSRYNWSRGNSSNKLFEYMASGKPIISTVKMGYSILDKWQCGVSLDRDTPEALSSAILEMYRLPEDEYRRLGENARNGAAEYDYTILTQKLIAVVESVLP